MINFILSLILGVGLDSLYYYLYLSKIKKIKNKRLLLYILIFIGYVFLFMILRYNLYLYLIFYIYIYLILKFNYKSQINDFFITVFLDIFYISISALCFFLIKNYLLALLIDKLLLFVPLLFMDKIKFLYKKYCNFWNRSFDNKPPIKSLTLRNCSLVCFNLIILISDLLLIYLIRK